jgi:hypothetical protein
VGPAVTTQADSPLAVRAAPFPYLCRHFFLGHLKNDDSGCTTVCMYWSTLNHSELSTQEVPT